MRWPFAARNTEIQRVRAPLGEGRGVVLIGAAGVGKTRLAREAVRTRPAIELHASPTTGTQPLGVFRPLLAPGPEPSIEEAVAGVRAELSQRTTPRARSVLVVDDAQALDEASVEVVARLTTHGIAVLLTVTEDLPVPDELRRLWQEERLERVAVKPLDRAGVASVAGAALGGPVAQVALDELFRLSAGNLLYLHELVVDALERGSLRLEDGVWTTTPPLAPSPQLRHLLERRLARSSPAAREALDLIAYAQPISLQALEQLVDLVVLEELEQRRLVETVDDGAGAVTLRLAHPLHAEVVRGGLTVLQRRRLARQLAMHTPVTGLTDAELERLARVRLDADDPDPDLYVAAGRLAYGRRDHTLALTLGTAARDAGAGHHAHALIAVAAGELGADELALAAYRDARTTAADPLQRVWIDIGEAYLRGLRLGQLDAAAALLTASLADAPDGPARDDVRAWLDLLAVIAPSLRGPPPVHVSAEAPDPGSIADQPRAATVTAVAHLLGAAAQLDLRTLERAWQVVQRWADDPAARRALPCAVDLCTVHRLRSVALGAGLVHADRLAEQHLERCAGGVPEAVATATWGLGWVRLQQGRGLDAVTLLTEASHDLDRWLPVLAAPDARLDLVHALAAVGRTDEGVRLLATMRAGHPEPPRLQLRGELAGAVLASSLERTSETVRRARDVARAAAAQGLLSVAVEAWQIALRLGATEVGGPGLEAKVTAGELDAGGRVLAAHNDALARRDHVALTAVAATYRTDGRLLDAAAATAQAARAAEDAGETRIARRLRTRSEVLASSCPGITLERRARSVTPLTAREQQIVGLAGSGRSNRAIAELLAVSVRTVETHLSTAYGKLGVAGRRELRPTARPDPRGASRGS